MKQLTALEIKTRRKELGMTQTDLAKEAGLSRRTIISYEQGEKIPNTKSELLRSILYPDSPAKTPRIEAVPLHTVSIDDIINEKMAVQKREIDRLRSELKRMNSNHSKIMKILMDVLRRNASDENIKDLNRAEELLIS